MLCSLARRGAGVGVALEPPEKKGYMQWPRRLTPLKTARAQSWVAHPVVLCMAVLDIPPECLEPRAVLPDQA